MVKRTAIYFLLPVVLACGALFPTQGSAEESNEIAALKSRFEISEPTRQRGMLGPVREIDRGDAG